MLTIKPSIETCLKILSTKSVGPIKFFKLLNKYQDKVLDHIDYSRDISQVLNECEKYQISIIPYYSERYPRSLLSIDNPPPIIFVKGNIDLLKRDCISIVGSREPSAIGLKVAYSWAQKLSHTHTIVSGMAKGIDTAVARGAKESIAVIASGIIACSSRHQEVLDNNGLLVSEFFPRTYAKVSAFAMRNRIISGLSESTIIIESRINSGTMRTARMTLQQKRTLFVIPGHILDYHYEGNNYLLQKYKANIALNVSDILNQKEKVSTERTIPITRNEKIYSMLSTQPIYIEELSYLTKIHITEMQKIISELEAIHDNIIVSYDGKVSVV